MQRIRLRTPMPDGCAGRDFVQTIYDGPVTTAGEQLYPGRVRGE